jgi:hypothetical protein
MDSPVSQPSAPCNGADAPRTEARRESISQHSDDSRTAAEYVDYLF